MGKQKKMKKLKASSSPELRDCTNTTQNSTQSLSLEVPRRVTVQSCSSSALLAHFHLARVSPIVREGEREGVTGAATSTPLSQPPRASPLQNTPNNSQLTSATPPHTGRRDRPRPLHTPTGELKRPLRVSEEVRSRESFRAMMKRARPYERYVNKLRGEGECVPVCPLLPEYENTAPARVNRKLSTNYRWPRDVLEPASH